MNIELRRYGIVIKSTRVTGDKASIGSGADCDIMIEDPYLSAHVGDVVRRGEIWYIVDAGTSLDGITLEGERIDDEAIIAGRVYSIGGFELVAQLPAAAERSMDVPPTRSGLIPGTIVELGDVSRSANAIPGTVVEPIPHTRYKEEIPGTIYEAQIPSAHSPRIPQAPAQQQVAVPIKQASSSRRGLLLAVFAMGVMLLLVLLVMSGDKEKNITTQTAPATASAAVATAAPSPAPAVPTASAAELLGSLKYDRALKVWEIQLAKADDPEIRARYANLAFEIGRIRAANQLPGASGYFERVVKFGPAGSEAVAEAKRRLGN